MFSGDHYVRQQAKEAMRSVVLSFLFAWAFFARAVPPLRAQAQPLPVQAQPLRTDEGSRIAASARRAGRSTEGGRPGAEDRAAFRAARAVTDPEGRMEALLQFAAQYPESALRPRATELALATDLRAFPERREQIRGLASQEIAGAPAGLERWIEEARVADALAGAGPAGAGPAGAGPQDGNLMDAARWAQAALRSLTEESFRQEELRAQRRYQLPALTAGEVHREFVRNRVMFLAAMAHVDLRSGRPEAAGPLLEEAYRLDPLSSEVNLLRGELALSGHHEAEALEFFERAEATGALPEPWRGKLPALYEANGGTGGAAGLALQVDAMYRRIFPPLYRLSPRRLPAGGRTALLELFTGSGCEPCVAPDLAVESLLTTYRPQDLAVLEWDENIPRPDPLANPFSEKRAEVYGVGKTPEAFLDGEPLPVAGSARGDVENVVVGFADAIENEAAQPSPVRLKLELTVKDGAVVARAAVSAAPPQAAAAGVDTGRTVLYMALVQDGVRYSGENGVRFHRMVVRAAAPATVLRPVGAAEQVAESSFDLQAVGAAQGAYLDAFESGNDRFGEVRFLTKDLPLEMRQMGVVAWVENPSTHEVLQAASASAGGGR